MTTLNAKDHRRPFAPTQLGILYELREYGSRPVEDSGGGETVAGKIGLPPEQVFSRLWSRAVIASGGLFQPWRPVSAELNLFVAGGSRSTDRKIQPVPMAESFVLTGHLRGGVTAWAGKKDYPVFADETIRTIRRLIPPFPAGVRGLRSSSGTGDCVRATKATIAAIAGKEVSCGVRQPH